jgi:predicted ATPase
VKLLERESQLQLFDHLFQRIAEGEGVCALLYGEAGIGKTTLVQQFVAAHSAHANILACGCEALFTPRPLGPLVDLADQFPPSLSSALHAGHTYNGLFPAFLSYLRQSKLPTVFIIEDVHWADDSTLDFIRYIARRLTGVRAMLLLTYRDDEITTAHPLRRVLGDLPTSVTVRVPLKPLSRDAVEQLAKHSHRAAEGLFDATGGNPFFVTEVLATQHGGVPPSVLDAVIARLSRLSAPARELLDVCCVVPNRIELAIVDNLLADADSRIDECVTAGALQVHAPHLQFRHELARLAVEQSLTSDQRLKLHRRVFDTLCLPSSSSFASLSRLVHHAERGAINKEVLALAPRAAREAAAASAHREAAALFGLALKHAHKLEAKERAKLLEEAAQEYRLISASDEAISCMQEALTLRQQTGDVLHEGMNLRQLATTQWHEVGDRDACQALMEQALKVLESIRPSVELSLAHSAMSYLHTAWSEYSQAIEHGEIALSISEPLDNAAALVDALHATAAAKMYLSDDRQARAQLERALDIAIAHKMEGATGLVYMTLQTSCLIYRDHAYALNVGERGIAYCEARDMDVYLMRLYDRRALSLVELGRWEQADRDLERCLSSPTISVRLSVRTCVVAMCLYMLIGLNYNNIRRRYVSNIDYPPLQMLVQKQLGLEAIQRWCKVCAR